jgi:phosphoribosylformylglycinamidine cyclo-ligase
MMDAHTYASAGVNIAKSEAFVERLKKLSRRPGHDTLWPSAGGYASIVPVSADMGIALTTDGVGTKLLVATEVGQLRTIGIDLVAMCANDLICVGAKPTAFLDYYATPHLEDFDADSLIEGIVKGCDQSSMLLVGGETAELPGLYAKGHFDLAGFAMGTVTKETLLDPKSIEAGDTLIGIASSGIHSNGLSLARKVIAPESPTWRELLTPTLIYVKPAVKLLEENRGAVKGLVHITGGGWRNLTRLKSSIGFHITDPLPLPPVFEELRKFVAADEMYKTYNMGMGLCVIARSQPDSVIDCFTQAGFKAAVVGKVTSEAETVVIESAAHNFSGSPIVLKG